MKKIIVTIDSHNIETTEEEYSKAFNFLESELVRRGWHFDDSPFGSILPVCNSNDYDKIMAANDDGFKKQILTRSPINPRFDIVNYVKRGFEKCDLRKPEPWQTTKERLDRKRDFDNFFNIS